jgi:hypothetical protein
MKNNNDSREKDASLLSCYLLALASEDLESTPNSENLKKANKQIKLKMASRFRELINDE